MKSKVKSVISILIMSIIILLSITTKANAEGFSVSASKSTATVGDTFTVTINSTGLTGRYTISGNSNVTINGETSLWIEGTSSTINCTAKAEGTATITVTPVTVADAAGNDVTLSAKSASVTVKAKETTPTTPTTPETPVVETPTTPEVTVKEVSDTVYATQSGVNIRSGAGTSYSSIGSTTKDKSYERTGTTSNEWSRIKFNGKTAYVITKYLTTTKPVEEKEEPTENTVKNEVTENTVENATTNEITTTATDDENTVGLALKTLTIKNVDTSSIFSPAVYEYQISVAKGIKKLEITATANQNDATIEIIGNENFEDGENTVTIILKSADGTQTITYQLVVNVGGEVETSIIPSNMDIIIYIVIGIIALFIVIIIVALIVMHKREKEDSYEDYDLKDDDENQNMGTINSNIGNNIENIDNVLDEDMEAKDKKTGKKGGRHF